MRGLAGSDYVSKCATYTLLGGYNICGKDCVINQSPNNESLGINEFVIYANECMAGCLECTDAVSCSKCPVGQYLETDNTTRTCNDCNFKCKTCSNAINCNTCYANRVLANGCGCPVNNYDNLKYQEACFPCSNISAGCSTCDNVTCQACLAPNFLDGNLCVIDCPADKWGNTATRQCTACQAKCLTCSNGNNCDTCFSNRVVPNCGCPVNNYDNLKYQEACFPCSNISVGCSICDNKTCQSCLSTHFLDGNQCVINCPADKWGNTATRQCTVCQAKCLTCSNGNTCDTCFSNRVVPNCGCPVNNYDNSDYLQACFPCSNISVGCSTCDNVTCQACLPSYFLDGNSCVIDCPAGKWGNTATRQCKACQAKCVTCSNDNTCDTCFQNRVPQQCNCPQYSYDTNVFSQTCTMCSTFSTGCATCSTTECLTYTHSLT
ncbi:zinc finger lsd1 subclass family protein, putative [Ichthyophthirius multifiliis]|uniref:Zinc finger lsd1 subclass family protein, putative n=1 Tax=Ichthyophthirius multifiliis TaxID=5932 RepID=G0QSX5_ICHMU|nr:zinc finger lsd1 subclass family protein, putative [Ichthyophthirius multifiliis]EGR31680.1 zinc finger lsd1 subclass family protein, putative [Ichthyophthirius multifiliis]|eukprot:XP_004035166.1 zinc finger lsd1 subclass family protein, putative [Ichthyophthirius multifiliis]